MMPISTTIHGTGIEGGAAMIVARIEIWPCGDPRALRQIAAVGITNVGPDEDGYHACEARSEGRMVRLRHRREDGPITLLRLALEALEAESDQVPGSRRPPPTTIPSKVTTSP